MKRHRPGETVLWARRPAMTWFVFCVAIIKSQVGIALKCLSVDDGHVPIWPFGSNGILNIGKR